MIQNPLGGYSYLICVGEIKLDATSQEGGLWLNGGKSVEERRLWLKGYKRNTIYHGLPILC